MKISVIICTFNRAESLKRTLESIHAMYVPEGLSWELIIVDNNSKDNTMAAVEEFKKDTGLNIICVFEEKQGLSYARNRGLKEKKGEITAFTDDDAVVDKYWLVNIVKAFEDYDAVCIGGKILPIWEKTHPGWLNSDFYSYLALLDLGNKYIMMKKPNLWGANFAVKSSMFKKYGVFNTNVGRTPTKLYGFEETFFIDTLIKNQEKVLYSPHMIVHHCIPEKRLKKSYFRKWHYDQGELKGLQINGKTLWKRVKFFLWAIKTITINLFKFLWLSAIKPAEAFREQLRFIYDVGFIIGFIKHSCIPKNIHKMLIKPKL